jgi:hypothetical protein
LKAALEKAFPAIEVGWSSKSDVQIRREGVMVSERAGRFPHDEIVAALKR